MKDTNKKFEQKLKQDLEQYFNNVEVPELSVEKQEELKKLVIQNKYKKKKIPLWKKITAIASAICLIALVIIPTVIMLNKKDDNSSLYFGKAEATKIPHNLEETQEIVNTKSPKYNFMFEDLSFFEATGFYNPKNNSLLAIRVYFNEKEIPYTEIEIHIIFSKQFIFDDQEIYTTHAEYSKTDKYEMYKIVHQEVFTEYERGYIIFDNHEIYIYLAHINDELFNKFI